MLCSHNGLDLQYGLLLEFCLRHNVKGGMDGVRDVERETIYKIRPNSQIECL
jgi:hypothetical protein